MARQQTLRKLALLSAAAALFAFAAVEPVEARGRYNMPVSIAQCVGYGYGAGYHAPLLLGPATASGIETKRVERVWRAPYPLGCDNGFCQASLLPSPGAPGGCYGSGCGAGPAGMGLDYGAVAYPEAIAPDSPHALPTPAYPH